MSIAIGHRSHHRIVISDIVEFQPQLQIQLLLLTLLQLELTIDELEPFFDGFVLVDDPGHVDVLQVLPVPVLPVLQEVPDHQHHRNGAH